MKKVGIKAYIKDIGPHDEIKRQNTIKVLEDKVTKLHNYIHKPLDYVRSKNDLRRISELRIDIKNGYHMLGKSEDFIDKVLNPRAAKYLPPSRSGKRVLHANLEPAVFELFRELAQKLNVSTDYLAHRAIDALFKEEGLEMPPSGKERLRDSARKKPGRPAGRRPHLPQPENKK